MEEDFKQTLITCYTWFSVIGPILNYYPQLKLMQKHNSIGSFSMFVSQTMILSSLLRIIFYFGHHYDFCLLAQSIIMLFIQFYILKVVYQIKRKNEIKADNIALAILKSQQDLRFLGILYCLFTISYTFLFIYYKSNTMIELTGILSAMVESFLPIPQFWNNYQRKSVESLSFLMIFFWCLGDSIKFFYYIMRQQPMQFIICSVIQITFDFSILSQFYTYRKTRGDEIEQIVMEAIEKDVENQKQQFNQQLNLTMKYFKLKTVSIYLLAITLNQVQSGLVLSRTVDNQINLPQQLQQKQNLPDRKLLTNSEYVPTGFDTNIKDGTDYANHMRENVRNEDKESFNGAEDYEPGSDLRTQMIRSSLDFTDDIREIIKRILVMRRDLKKAKNANTAANNLSIFAGSSYQNYDNTPQVNRPSYLQTNLETKGVLNNQHKGSERILFSIKNKKEEKMLKQFMNEDELDNAGISKALDNFKFNDMYKIKKEDLEPFKKKVFKMRI